jgi:hypothetical protein
MDEYGGPRCFPEDGTKPNSDWATASAFGVYLNRVLLTQLETTIVVKIENSTFLCRQPPCIPHYFEFCLGARYETVLECEIIGARHGGAGRH